MRVYLLGNKSAYSNLYKRRFCNCKRYLNNKHYSQYIG